MAAPTFDKIAREVARGLRAAKLVSPVTLTRLTKSMHVPHNTSAGANPQSTTYACEGFISSTRKQFIGGTQVVSGDVVVVLLGESLPADFKAASGDRVAIHGSTLRVLSVDVDAANATQTLLTRE